MLGLAQPGLREKTLVSKGLPLTSVQLLIYFNIFSFRLFLDSNSVTGSNDRWSVLTNTQYALRLRRRWSGPCAAPSLTGQPFWHIQVPGLPGCAKQYHAIWGRATMTEKIRHKLLTKVSWNKNPATACPAWPRTDSDLIAQLFQSFALCRTWSAQTLSQTLAS